MSKEQLNAREALKDTDARGFKLESEFLSIQSTRRYFLKKWCVTGSGLLAETADFAAENFAFTFAHFFFRLFYFCSFVLVKTLSRRTG